MQNTTKCDERQIRGWMRVIFQIINFTNSSFFQKYLPDLMKECSKKNMGKERMQCQLLQCIQKDLFSVSRVLGSHPHSFYALDSYRYMTKSNRLV